MRAAPSDVVAVPITMAPSCAKASAMALPMPRVAPVTSATGAVLLSSTIDGSVVLRCVSIRGRDRGHGSIDRVAVGQRMRFEIDDDTPGEARQHLAGTGLHHV